jgi:hypothetical protein
MMPLIRECEVSMSEFAFPISKKATIIAEGFIRPRQRRKPKENPQIMIASRFARA